jgi:Hemimethylated DNA-binding protein YccV like
MSENLYLDPHQMNEDPKPKVPVRSVAYGYSIFYILMSRLGYRGVIIGWDEVARAPEQWLKLMHKENM